MGQTYRLIVVKLGTSSITHQNGRLNLEEMRKIVDQIAKVVDNGHKIVLVTSGAVASGIAELKVRPNPNDIIFKQACASIGQSILMAYYRDLFRKHGIKVSQILLTREDLSNRVSYLHTCNVLDLLLQLGVVPIINENDVTSIDELMPISGDYEVNFSDNDILSVLIANAIQADLIIILSDVDGLYTADPRKPDAQLIRVVDEITPELEKMLGGKSNFGRGGMKTKLQAAEIATQSSIPVIIANSHREGVIVDSIAGRQVGTFFKPRGKRIPSLKKWIAYGTSIKGRIKVNEGAEKAIVKGASLLPIGITEIQGSFKLGDVVELIDQEGKIFGRGMVHYSSDEVNLVKGRKTNQIEEALGYIRQKEIISRKFIHLLNENKKTDEC